MKQLNIDRPAVESALRELGRLTVLIGATVLAAWLTGIIEGLDGSSVAAIVLGLAVKFIDRYAYKSNGINITKI